jgi:tRNA(Ile)-lysidine synthase
MLLQAATSQGLQATELACLQARPREGGEQFQRSRRGTARGLKKQYQAAGLPAWERDGPLLWKGDQLVFAPGLGVDARHWAPEGVPQWRLQWQPAGDASGRDPGQGGEER